MQVDRTRFLAFVSLISAAACSAAPNTPSSAPAAPPPAATPLPPSPDPATPAAAPQAQPTPGPTTATVPPPQAPTAEAEDPGKDCDQILIGPCGEGGSVRSICRSNASNLEGAARNAFLSCVAQGRSKIAVGGGCAQAVNQCEGTRVRCAGVQRQLDACNERATNACNQEAEKTAQCISQCLGADPGSGSAGAAKFGACQKRCGDPDAQAEKCRTNDKQCKALRDSDNACSQQAGQNCALPANCQPHVTKACQAGSELLQSCYAKASGR